MHVSNLHALRGSCRLCPVSTTLLVRGPVLTSPDYMPGHRQRHLFAAPEQSRHHSNAWCVQKRSQPLLSSQEIEPGRVHHIHLPRPLIPLPRLLRPPPPSQSVPRVLFLVFRFVTCVL